MDARLPALLATVSLTMLAALSCTSDTDAVDPELAGGPGADTPIATPAEAVPSIAAPSAPTQSAPPPAVTAAASPTAKPAPSPPPAATAAAEPIVTPAPTPPPSAPAPTGAPDVSEEVSPLELGITLEAIDDFCDTGDDFQGAAQVRWTVDGGRAPYEVWVNGELQVGESGVVEAPCVGLRWVDFLTWTRTAEDLPLTVVGTVIDAGGVRASDLLLIQRPPAGPNPPGNGTQAFDGGVDTLTFELFAPRICDAQVWGRYSRIPFADTGIDDVTMEVEWRVSGGRPPYTVYLAGGEFEGDSGTLRVQCRHLEDGMLDSGWLSVMGLARDSEGAVGSAIVETFALARSASTPRVENYRMNGGRTYKFEGILMTIPDGLTIDVGGEFGSYHVHCGADACRDSSCANSTYSNVCEDAFRVATLGGQVGVTFGYGTGQMLGRGTILEGWREGGGVQTDSRAELEALMDAWAESVGRALDLSAARWLNPAPLRITAYPDPVVCDPSFDLRPVDDIGFVHVIVAGGAWVPTGIELDGEVVALARGSGRVVVRVDCSREPAMHDMLLNVHDLGPQTPASIVETTIEMNFLPSQRVGGGLGLATSRTPYYEPPAFDPTAYCEPGGKAKIAWSLFNSHATGYGAIAKPTTVRIDGELAVSRADPSQISVDYGEHWVTCQQEPGLQTVVIEATDSGTPSQSARYEYLLRVVESHPSGLEWSEIRPEDYPEFEEDRAARERRLFPHLVDDVDEPVVVFSGATSAEAMSAVRNELSRVQAFFGEHFGAGPADYTVHLASDLASAEAVHGEIFGTAPSGGFCSTSRSGPMSAIVLYPRNCRGPFPYGDPSGVLASYHVGHVAYRLWSAAPLPLAEDGHDRLGPRWLRDAIGSYARHAYGAAAEIRTMNDVRDEAVQLAEDFDGPLASVGTAPGLQPRGGQALLFLAGEWLADRAGEPALLDYYRQLPSSDSWHEAFEASFGMTVDDFHEAFEAYRADVARPVLHVIRGWIRDSGGNASPGTWVAAARDEGRWEDTAQTGKDGNFILAVRDGRYDLYVDLTTTGCAVPTDDRRYDGGAVVVQGASTTALIELPEGSSCGQS